MSTDPHKEEWEWLGWSDVCWLRWGLWRGGCLMCTICWEGEGGGYLNDRRRQESAKRLQTQRHIGHCDTLKTTLPHKLQTHPLDASIELLICWNICWYQTKSDHIIRNNLKNTSTTKDRFIRGFIWPYWEPIIAYLRDAKSSGSIVSQIASLNTSYVKSMGSTEWKKEQKWRSCEDGFFHIVLLSRSVKGFDFCLLCSERYRKKLSLPLRITDHPIGWNKVGLSHVLFFSLSVFLFLSLSLLSSLS